MIKKCSGHQSYVNINYSLSLSLSCSLTISSRVYISIIFGVYFKSECHFRQKNRNLKNCIFLSKTQNEW